MTNHPTSKMVIDYRRQFGPDYYSFHYRDLFGIVLNSTIIIDSSAVKNETIKQERWLQNMLHRAKREKYKFIVIFQHHPWFLQRSDEDDNYWNIQKSIREKYLKLFKKYKVQYIFAGHLHRNVLGATGDLQMITTGPVGRPLGKDSSGFCIAVVKDNIIAHHYYSLDSIPNRIDLSTY